MLGDALVGVGEEKTRGKQGKNPQISHFSLLSTHPNPFLLQAGAEKKGRIPSCTLLSSHSPSWEGLNDAGVEDTLYLDLKIQPKPRVAQRHARHRYISTLEPITFPEGNLGFL